MDEIRKSFSGEPMKADAEKDIVLINKYALRELSPEEVFVFNVNLCDNQIDRDLEAFSIPSLRKLKELFIGKPLIQDHAWSASNQQGRIYKTQLVRDGSVTRLRASIYMLRTPGSAETIQQIEAGILREVSIGFSAKRTVCSVCGEDLSYDYTDGKRKCSKGHIVGEKVGGQVVHGILEDPVDAYEVSLVAVPSQRQAGITKGVVGKRSFSPEESAERKGIVEKVTGLQISDAVWRLIIDGKCSVADYVAANEKQEKKQTYYPDIIPEDDDSYDSIQFALIPDNIIDEGTMTATFRALGFCRKELRLQPIHVKWFATVGDASRLGLDPSSLRKFLYNPDCLGLASRQNPHQILVRYPQSYSMIMKTVAHELWHAFQMKDEWNPLAEDSAYWYMEDMIKRYQALSAKEQEEFFYGELLMRDYSKG